MRRYLFGFATAIAGALALSVSAGAQAPSQTPQPPQTAPGATAEEESADVTVEGCLMREADVPGREPNVAERAGVMEDYILTDAKIVEGSEQEGGAAESSTRGASSVSAAGGDMYEIEGIDDEQLRQHVDSRVQIKGTLENVDQAQDPPEGQAPTDDLPEIRGTAIDKAASGECRAQP